MVSNIGDRNLNGSINLGKKIICVKPRQSNQSPSRWKATRDWRHYLFKKYTVWASSDILNFWLKVEGRLRNSSWIRWSNVNESVTSSRVEKMADVMTSRTRRKKRSEEKKNAACREIFKSREVRLRQKLQRWSKRQSLGCVTPHPYFPLGEFPNLG